MRPSDPPTLARVLAPEVARIAARRAVVAGGPAVVARRPACGILIGLAPRAVVMMRPAAVAMHPLIQTVAAEGTAA